MTDCRCRRNVYILAIAFLCNFASYMTLESMQSSLHRGVGTTALCLLYASIVLSSLFLPPLVIQKLDCRKSLTLSILSFAVYTLANFYPKAYTLIPAAVFLGMGSSVMWSCSFYYIMQLSQKHAEEKKKDIEEVTGEFFGKFTAISHVSILVGTIFMSAVFESVGIDHDHSAETIVDIDGNNTLPTQTPEFNATEFRINNMTTATSEVYFEFTTSTMSLEDTEQCGLYYKFAETVVEHEKGVDDMVMYVLLSAYLAFNLVAALLCLCLDEVTGSETSAVQEAVCVSMLSVNNNGMDVYKNHESVSPEEDGLSNNYVGAKILNRASSFQLIKSTLQVLATDKAAWLLIPFTLHYGMVQGFARGVYNASWVTCALGIKYVAYVTCMYAAVMILSCYTFGKMLRVTTHARIFCCTMAIEIATFIILLFWQPSATTTWETALFFAVPFLLGICHASLSSQIGSIYSKFFPDNRKSGSSLQGIWNPLGSAIAYGLSGPLFPIHMIIMVMSVCVAGLGLYLVAEKIKTKPYRKCAGCPCI